MSSQQFNPSMTSLPMKFMLHKQDRQRRRRLVLLTRILMKYLENTNNVTMLHRVKAVIRDCTKRHRLGDTSISPLQDAIESRLQIMVDDHIWNRVLMCLELYMSQEQKKKSTIPSISASSSAPASAPMSNHVSAAQFYTGPQVAI